MKEFNRDIVEAIDLPDFFDMSQKSLKIWSKFIYFSVEDIIGEVYTKYVSKVNFSNFFSFSSKSSQNNIWIKSFQRLCFLIYCVKNEKFFTKEWISILFKKIKDILNERDINDHLIVLMMFLMRILLYQLTLIESQFLI